jgi:PKD domain
MAQDVVAATVFGGAGGATTRAVSAQALGGCPLYSGGPMVLHPSGQPFQPASGSSWSVSTVLSCALGIPTSDLNSVQLYSPQHGYESPLSGADLTDPGRYHDPTSPQALPVISSDGNEYLNIYDRPWRGGNDANGSDQVEANQSPISLVVFEKGAPLTVRAARQVVSRDGSSFSDRLSATVSDAGAPVPSSALRWSWNFGDGRTSTLATPTHSFLNGAYAVTVVVTDRRSGSGGTATLVVSRPSSVPAGRRARTGGASANKSPSPTGSDHGSPTQTGTPGAAKTSNAGQQATTATSTKGAANARASARHRGKRASVSKRRAPTIRTRKRGSQRGNKSSAAPLKLVTGRLIADVTPVPSGSAALLSARPPAAGPIATVRGARSAPTPLSAPGAALGVLVLLALGALNERRGLHRRRLPADA